MLFRAELGETNKKFNPEAPKQTNIFFPDDSLKEILSDDLEVENFVDNSGIEHVRVFKSAYTPSETDELWEIYLYDDEAMPLELNLCQNEDSEN